MTDLTKKRISELTDLKPRQVQFYTEEGVIVPESEKGEGRGKVRRYSEKNLLEFLLVKEMADFGMTVGRIKGIIFHTSAELVNIQKEMSKDPGLSYYLVILKGGAVPIFEFIKLKQNEETIVTVSMMHNYAGCFVIDLGQLIKKTSLAK